jgi:hypothetical protein
MSTVTAWSCGVGGDDGGGGGRDFGTVLRRRGSWKVLFRLLGPPPPRPSWSSAFALRGLLRGLLWRRDMVLLLLASGGWMGRAKSEVDMCLGDGARDGVICYD